MQQSLEIIRRRVDETGTREPSIQRQGADRILVQVPGIGSAEELLAVIGQTARLSFHPVVSRTTRRGTRARARRGGLSDRWTSRASSTCSSGARSSPATSWSTASRASTRTASRRSASASTRPAARPSAPTPRENIGKPVRHRARRGGDLGAGDPEPHRRRLGHHHRQLHPGGVRRGWRSCCAPARCRPRSPCSSSAPSGRSSAPTRSPSGSAGGAGAPSSASSPSWSRPTACSAPSPRSAW